METGSENTEVRITNNYKKPVRKPPKPTNNLTSGFFDDCLPFTLVSLLTILIGGFDVLADWFTYQTVRRINLSSYITSNTNETGNQNGFISIFDRLLFGFCITSALIYALHIGWFLNMTLTRWRMFMQKRDGVRYVPSCIERFGSEVIMLFQCVCQDLPISILLFTLQYVISCDFICSLTHPIFIVCFISTILSASFKIVILSFRSIYDKIRKGGDVQPNWPMKVLRVITCILCLIVLAFSSLNVILSSSKTPISPTQLKKQLFNKVGMDKWLQNDDLIIYANTKNRSLLHIPVIKLKDVIEREGQVVGTMQKKLPTWLDPAYLDKKDRLNNCTLIYEFLYEASNRLIFYNYAFKCLDSKSECVSIILPDDHEITSNYKEKHKSKEIPTISLSKRNDLEWVKCSELSIVRNSTMLSFNPCAYFPLEQ